MAILHRKLSSDAEAEYSSPPPPSAIAHTNHVIPYLVSAACILGIAFLLLTTCTILLRHRWTRRRSSRRISSTSRHSDEDHGPVDHPIWHIVTVGLPQSIIDSITAVSYKSCDGVIEGSDCSVCLTKFEDGDEVRLLPKCSHAFHLPCIDTWLRSHKNCPLCRSPVVNDSNPNSGPSESLRIENSENQREETTADVDDDNDELDTLPVQVEGSGIAEIWKSDQVLSDVPVRRSISLDSPAAYEYAVNKSGVVNGEGSSKQQSTVEVEEDDKEGHGDSAISRMMKRSLSSSAKILSPFRGSKSQSSSSTLPL